jgi:hypothetical protein
MLDSNRHIMRRRDIFLAAWLLAIALLLVGCSTGESDPPSPTPTLADLSVPPVADQTTAGKGGGDVQQTPTSLAYAPTPSPPDATEQAIAQETALDEQATETVERANIPKPIQTNEATVEPPAVDMDVAWGPSPGLIQVPIALDNESMFVLDSVDPDGTFVVGAIVPRAIGSTTPVRLVLVDVKDGHITDIAQYVGPIGEIIYMGGPPVPPLFGADTDGKTVIWNDQSVVHAYTISTGITRILPELPAEQNKLPTATPAPYFPGIHVPRVDHGFAAWQEYAYVEPNSPLAPARIMKADLATGDVTELSDYGTEAVVSWPYIGWIEYPKSANKWHHGIITLFNLETGEKKSLDSIQDAATFGLGKDAIIYSRTSGQAFITDLNGTSSRLISGDSFLGYRYISLNERLATWLGSPSIAYDHAQDRRVYLKSANPSFPSSAMRIVKGHTLAWQTGGTYVELDGAKLGTVLPNDQFVYLVDTDKLLK